VLKSGFIRHNQPPVEVGITMKYNIIRIENSIVGSGIPKIVAKRENYTNQGVNKQFTSARLNSKFAFRYGRVDDAKVPVDQGTYPNMVVG
jgi:hypothetical protein